MNTVFALLLSTSVPPERGFSLLFFCFFCTLPDLLFSLACPQPSCLCRASVLWIWMTCSTSWASVPSCRWAGSRKASWWPSSSALGGTRTGWRRYVGKKSFSSHLDKQLELLFQLQSSSLSRRPWPSTSPTPPPCTSTCCRCTATAASKARAPSCCGATCSTCAACRASVVRYSSARISWCPSTARLASRRGAPPPSPYLTCASRRWSTCSAGRHTRGGIAAASRPVAVLFTHPHKVQ